MKNSVKTLAMIATFVVTGNHRGELKNGNSGGLS